MQLRNPQPPGHEHGAADLKPDYEFALSDRFHVGIGNAGRVSYVIRDRASRRTILDLSMNVS